MLQLDGENLTIENVVAIARDDQKVEIAPQARQKISESQAWVEAILAKDTPVYGINTGFGIFANKHISPQEAEKLNRNLILSHAVGTGPNLPQEVVRAAMAIRANTLSSGYSGIRPELIENLLSMLNKGVTPLIPSQGSLGSSGDLAPLSHLALVFTTDEQDRDQDSGYATLQDQTLTGKTAMQKSGIPRLILGPKEALAITNGATFSAALAALSIHLTHNLIATAEVAVSMSLEAMMGASAAFDPRLHEIRRQTGQIEVARRIRALTQGSTLLDAAGHVQDAYSLRCAPQVHGPVRDISAFIQDTITREINAVTDNPLLFAPGEAISGGNFHGQPIGMAMDYLKIALSELGAISERRVFLLTDEKMNAGLPPMLVDSPSAAGINSGMMMLQYTSASLVLENQSLASPDSVLSLPTSGGKEDHNANAMTAARNAWKTTNNLAHILAIEIYCAGRAVDLRLREHPRAHLGVGVQQAHQTLRNNIPFQAGDTLWGPEIEKVHELIVKGAFVINLTDT